ncbi:MAG: RIP metalloprotease RseP [Rhodospirillales bacterium]|nr:RIP metalloprotease RseP [Rhodospirillales bacterium]
MPAHLTLAKIAFLIFSYGIVTVLSIALVIIIHEFGHYLAARIFGIRITRFSLGFGKELWGKTDRLGTRWSVSRIPVGGYTEIFGDVDPDKPVIWDTENQCERHLTEDELKVAFCTKKVWQRMVVVMAGPAINIVLALSLLAFLYMLHGIQKMPPIINSIAVGKAADEAGFKLGDRLLEMDGRPVSDMEDIYDITSKDWINPHKYTVQRNNKILTIMMTAREIDFTDRKGRKVENRGRSGMLNGTVVFLKDIISINNVPTKDNLDFARELLKQKLGQPVDIEFNLTDESDVFRTIFPKELNHHLDNPEDEYYDRIFIRDTSTIEYKRLGPIEAFSKAASQIWTGLQETVGLFRVLYKGKTDEKPIGGVAVVAKYAGNSVKEGWPNVVVFVVILSIGIALINLLPIPLLDGGFLIFLIYEAFTGRRVSPRVQTYAFAIALVFMGGIMIIANLIDLIDFLND